LTAIKGLERKTLPESSLKDLRFWTPAARAALNLFSRYYFDSVTIQGSLPNPADNRGIIIAGNHPSNATVLPLVTNLLENAQKMPDKFVRKQRMPHMLAKEEFFNGITGMILRSTGQIPVNRSNGVKSLKQATAILKQGGLVGIYPEGTVTKDPNGWPTPVTEAQQLEYKLRGLEEGSQEYTEVCSTVKNYGFDGRYRLGAAWLAETTNAIIVPTLTYVDRDGPGANLTIQFDNPMPGQDLSTRQKQREFTAQMMLNIAEMMAIMKDEPLPPEIRSSILKF